MNKQQESRRGTWQLLVPIFLFLIVSLGVIAITILKYQHGTPISEGEQTLISISLFIVLGLVILKLGLSATTAATIVLGGAYTYLFFSYGSGVLLAIGKLIGIHFTAANYFIVFWLFLWVGGAIVSAIPQILTGNIEAVIIVMALFSGIGLIYTVIDNLGFGPPCAGKFSPYAGMNICELPPTAYASDCFLGCYLSERLGVSPYSSTGSALIYGSETIFFAGLGILLLLIPKAFGGKR